VRVRCERNCSKKKPAGSSGLRTARQSDDPDSRPGACGQVRAAPSVAAAGTAGADNGGDKRFDLSPRARMQPLLAVVSVGGQKK